MSVSAELVSKLLVLQYPRLQALQANSSILSFYEFTLIINFLENAYIRVLDETERRVLTPTNEDGDVTQYVHGLVNYLSRGELNLPPIIIKLAQRVVDLQDPISHPSVRARCQLALFLCNKAVEFEFNDVVGGVEPLRKIEGDLLVNTKRSSNNSNEQTTDKIQNSHTTSSQQDIIQSKQLQLNNNNNTTNNNNNNNNKHESTNPTVSNDACYPLQTNPYYTTLCTQYNTPIYTLEQQYPEIDKLHMQTLQSAQSFIIQTKQTSTFPQYMQQYSETLQSVLYSHTSLLQSPPSSSEVSEEQSYKNFNHQVINAQLSNIPPYTVIPIAVQNKDSAESQTQGNFHEISSSRDVIQYNIFEVNSTTLECNMTLYQFILYVVLIWKYATPLTRHAGMSFPLPQELHQFVTTLLFPTTTATAEQQQQQQQQFSTQQLYIEACVVYITLCSLIKEFVRYMNNELTTILYNIQQVVTLTEPPHLQQQQQQQQTTTSSQKMSDETTTTTTTTPDRSEIVNFKDYMAYKPTTPTALFQPQPQTTTTSDISAQPSNDNKMSDDTSQTTTTTTPQSASYQLQVLQKALTSETFAKRNTTTLRSLQYRNIFQNIDTICNMNSDDALAEVLQIVDKQQQSGGDNKNNNNNTKNFTFIQIITIARMLYDLQLTQQQDIVNRWIKYLQSVSSTFNTNQQ